MEWEEHHKKLVSRLIDENKLNHYLTNCLVAYSKKNKTAEMNVINNLIVELDNGTFNVNYNRLKDAVSNYDDYINSKV